MSINSKIKELRENGGLTQKNIADYLNIDQSMVSKIESGERSLQADMLDKLSALFGIHVSDILSKGTERTASLAFRANELSADDLQAIACINRIALNADFMTERAKR